MASALPFPHASSTSSTSTLLGRLRSQERRSLQLEEGLQRPYWLGSSRDQAQRSCVLWSGRLSAQHASSHGARVGSEITAPTPSCSNFTGAGLDLGAQWSSPEMEDALPPSLFKQTLNKCIWCRVVVVACGIQFPDQGLNLGPLHGELES